MHRRHTPGTFVIASAAVAGVLATLVSCSTVSFGLQDDLDRGAAKGWGVFLDDDTSRQLSLSIGRAGDSHAGRYFSRTAGVSYPYAIACPPGEQEFLIAHGGRYVERVTVPVRESLATCVGIQMQFIDADVDYARNQLTTSYQLNVTVGSHPFPLDIGTAGAAALMSALDDEDWATRWVAVWALRTARPTLDSASRARLAAVAREDPSRFVRDVAERTLRRLREQVPAEALLFYSLEEHVFPFSLSSGTTYSTSACPGGYLVDSNDEQQWVVQTPTAGISGLLAGHEELTVILECAWVSGKSTSGFGLALCTDRSTFHAFCVSKNGSAAIFSFVGNRLSANPVASTNTAATAMAAGRWVRIEVAKRGARYEMNVNGVEIGSFTDAGAGTLNTIGLYVHSHQAVVFRKIIVTAPDYP